MDKNLRAYVAELIGTFALVFLGAGSVCAIQVAVLTDQPAPGLTAIALANGLAYAAALAAVLPFSAAGYLNPAVTLMLWVFKRLDGLQTACLIFVQLLGAALAGGLLRIAFTELVLDTARLGTPHLNLKAFGEAGLTPGVLLRGVAVELALSFVLTFVLFATIIDPRTPRLRGATGRWLAGLWVGMVVAAATFCAYHLTGAAVNPARWFGPVLWETTVPPLLGRKPFADHLVYWFGPIAGALLAGVVYSYVFLPTEEKLPASVGAAPATGKTAGAAATLFRSKK
jgi:glycerol uptake facilitator-like aquaporin